MRRSHGTGLFTPGQFAPLGVVRILTSSHRLDEMDRPILHATVDFKAVSIGSGSDIGVGAIILAGVRIGAGAQVAAGALVTEDVEDLAVVAGVPARIIRRRS